MDLLATYREDTDLICECIGELPDATLQKIFEAACEARPLVLTVNDLEPIALYAAAVYQKEHAPLCESCGETFCECRRIEE